MERYIDADKFVKSLEKQSYYSKTNIETRISKMTTAYVQPVIHAFWFWTDDSKQRKELQCSNCGKFVKNHENLTYLEFTETFQYCPKCGAKMDEIYLTVRLEGE